jgi:hypothetical protein
VRYLSQDILDLLAPYLDLIVFLLRHISDI